MLATLFFSGLSDVACFLQNRISQQSRCLGSFSPTFGGKFVLCKKLRRRGLSLGVFPSGGGEIGVPIRPVPLTLCCVIKAKKFAPLTNVELVDCYGKSGLGQFSFGTGFRKWIAN